MLAAAVGAPLVAIRRWTRRRYLRPNEIRERVALYDFGEATVARRLTDLLASAGSLSAVDRLVDELNHRHQAVERPLLTLSLVVEGNRVLVRDGDVFAEPSGQRVLDFDGDKNGDDDGDDLVAIRYPEPAVEPRRAASDLRDEGRLAEAIETLRLAMLRFGAESDDHFTLGEWLYEAGEAEAARERFYAALELEGDHVEARVNLACVLAELGQTELAIAALRGAIEEHPFFADAQFHLASTLQRVGDEEAAAEHFRKFLELAPDSPWADEARRRLAESGPD